MQSHPNRRILMLDAAEGVRDRYGDAQFLSKLARQAVARRFPRLTLAARKLPVPGEVARRTPTADQKLGVANDDANRDIDDVHGPALSPLTADRHDPHSVTSISVARKLSRSPRPHGRRRSPEI